MTRGDDRVMAVLTAIVLVVAVAAMLPRSASVSQLFGFAAGPTPRDDAFRVTPGTTEALPVLANDLGLPPEGPVRLYLRGNPSCGRVGIRSDMIEIAGTGVCSGTVTFRYCIDDGDACPEAEVTVNFAAPAASPEVASPAPATAPARETAPEVAPEVALATPGPAAPAPAAAPAPVSEPAPVARPAPGAPSVTMAGPAPVLVPDDASGPSAPKEIALAAASPAEPATRRLAPALAPTLGVPGAAVAEDTAPAAPRIDPPVQVNLAPGAPAPPARLDVPEAKAAGLLAPRPRPAPRPGTPAASRPPEAPASAAAPVFRVAEPARVAMPDRDGGADPRRIPAPAAPAAIAVANAAAQPVAADPLPSARPDPAAPIFPAGTAPVFAALLSAEPAESPRFSGGSWRRGPDPVRNPPAPPPLEGGTGPFAPPAPRVVAPGPVPAHANEVAVAAGTIAPLAVPGARVRPATRPEIARAETGPVAAAAPFRPGLSALPPSAPPPLLAAAAPPAPAPLRRRLSFRHAPLLPAIDAPAGPGPHLPDVVPSDLPPPVAAAPGELRLALAVAESPPVRALRRGAVPFAVQSLPEDGPRPDGTAAPVELAPEPFAPAESVVLFADAAPGVPAATRARPVRSVPAIHPAGPAADRAPAPDRTLAAPPPRVAALPPVSAPTPAVTESAPPARPAAACAADLTLAELPGQLIQASLAAPCRGGERVEVMHGGLRFTLGLDAAGDTVAEIPAFEEKGLVTARFADGTEVTAQLRILGLDRIVRAAIVWRGGEDLNLHAFEFGADEGEDGHVWQGAPRSYRDARRDGGGFFLGLGLPDPDGFRVEVYSLPVGRTTPKGVVTLRLEIAGGACADAVEFAALIADSVRGMETREVRLAREDCTGTPSSRMLRVGLRDLSVAAR